MAKSTVKKPETKVKKAEVKAPPAVPDFNNVTEGETYEVKPKPNEPGRVVSVTIVHPLPPTPQEFLSSKGFSQVHEGQKIPATFEQIHELLKEYRAL